MSDAVYIITITRGTKPPRGTMSADSLDEVPDAASPDASAERWRRERRLFREKHGRDPTEEELHKYVLYALRATLQKRKGRDPTLAEYKAACESEGIPAAVLQSFLMDRTDAEVAALTEAAF